MTRRLSSRIEKSTLTRPLAPDVRIKVDESDPIDIVSTAIDDDDDDDRRNVFSTLIGFRI